MPDPSDFWYRLGYALENARHGQLQTALRPLAERIERPSRPRRRPSPSDANDAGPSAGEKEGGGEDALELLIAAGAGTLIARLLGAWPGRGRPGAGRLVRAGVAGAAAALLRQVVGPVLGGRPGLPEWDGELAEELAAGSARGLLYGTVVDPRAPGGPVLRGLTYGMVEYGLSPYGGLGALLGRHAPHRRVPLLADVLEGGHPGEESLADHLVFGVTMALLYGSNGSSRMGTGDDEA